ncbi:agamous-like MADS-box protein AGL62 [Carex littledalei]|uniref:Agamous-like MADS-box protein AGL62 n=1 Tax=Carex littledalei TaxID=544730 RepID=A0A833QZH1_9POAL|nr:agamous-like MADS-box protein AGL62 [Carex littledalei]
MENGSGSSNNQNQNEKKGGKRKIPMELIGNKNYRQVCFSKRRKGLFKKAEELSVLCGVNVKIVAFSPAGKPYFYTSPNCGSSSTLDHLFPTSTDGQTGTDHEGDASEIEIPNTISVLSQQASELRARLEASKRKNEILKAAIRKVTSEESVWRADLANADLARLFKLKSDLEQIRDVAFKPVP